MVPAPPPPMSALSGASSLACTRTSMNEASRHVAGVTLAVRPPSKLYGTSTPGTLRPSARMYVTW